MQDPGSARDKIPPETRATAAGLTGRSRWRPSDITLLFGVVLVVAILVVAVASAWELRKQEMGAWRTQLGNLSLTVSEHTAQNMASAYLALDSIVQSVRTLQARDARALRERAATSEMHEAMRDKIAGLPQADVATIVAANGDVINFTRSFPPPPINLADRDYFQEASTNSAQANFVSSSVRNKGNGKWVFYVSRRLNDAQGSFMGMVLLGISVDAFTNFHAQLGTNLGDGASITLLRSDFSVLARWPHRDEFIGQRVINGTSYTVIETMGKSADVIYATSPRSLDSNQELGRLAAVRAVSRYPLILNITVTRDLYLAGWYRSLMVIAGVTLVALLTLSAGILYLVGLLRRRELDMQRIVELSHRAEEASLAKSAFLATMSHEIRTPLNGVIGMTAMLADSPLDARQRQYAEVITSSGNSLMTIINDILDYSKIEAGKLDVESIDFDLHSLTRETCAPYQASQAERRLELRCDIAPGVPQWVRGDPTRVRQVLHNYLSNAWKFTVTGQIVLRVSVEPGQAATDAAAVRFSVSDTGIGMPAQTLDKLFTPFNQADSSSTRRYGGTGLGLAITRQLVELMHGRVGVSSVEGEGSVFWAVIPLEPGTAPPAPEPHPEPAAAPVAADAVRILVVEDNPTNQVVAVSLLGKLGYTNVRVAADGEEALTVAASEPLDLVLMDCQMPALDGYEVTRRLRTRGFTRPVVAMTANAMQGDRERCLAAGMNDYIAKPVSAQRLADTIRHWVRVSGRTGPGAAGEAASAPVRTPHLLNAGATPVFDRIGAAARLGGDDAMLDTIVAAALDDIPRTIAALEAAVAAGQLQTARRHAHSVKGAAASVGAEVLRHASARTEALVAQEAPASEVARSAAELRQHFSNFRQAVGTQA